jgi:hypothetical protein
MLISLVLCCAVRGSSQVQQMLAQPTQDSLLKELAAVHPELYLADSSLRIVNIYRAEAMTLLQMTGRPPAEVIDTLVSRVYRPYTKFWKGYLGDEAQFREWAATSLVAPVPSFQAHLVGLLQLKLDSLFTASATWLVRTTGRRPRGTWFIVFGPGWTDMGGFTDGTMVADFTRMAADPTAMEFKLAHELTHMARGASDAQRTDPDSGTVLSRIISEGLASYAAYMYAAGRLTPAQSLGYTEAEWHWALTHERELAAAARPLLSSRSRADITRIAAREVRLLDAGPTAAGYFLGFRMIQAYVAGHGAASWTDAIDMADDTLLLRSKYRF